MGLKEFIQNKENNQTGFNMDKRINPDICEISENLLINEFDNGVQIADKCDIEPLKNVFSWKRGFQNCFTGYPNEGKTQFTLFLMTVKSLKSGWKWVFWSPEMKSASFHNGTVEVHYNDLVNDIIAICSGLTVYKHIAEKYKAPRITKETYLYWVKWVKEHFICLDPKNNHIDHIYDLLMNTYEKQGFDGILIDPFKNVGLDEGGRDDQKLDKLFYKFKDLAIRTNTVMNWIAHPKANVQREIDGEKQVCSQYMLLGGASWDNNMDGIYSVFRPNTILDIKDTTVNFHNLKQRKQDLTTERGSFNEINFDVKTKRYTFEGLDILQEKGFKPLPF